MVAAARERLSPRRFVHQAHDRPVVAEFDPEMSVLEMTRTHSEPRRRGQFRAIEHDDTQRRNDVVARDRPQFVGAQAQLARRQRGIDDQQRVGEIALGGARDHRGERRLLRLPGRRDNCVEFGFGVLIDLSDARSGQDVVKFVLEHIAPLRLEARRRRRAGHMRQPRQGFGRDQRPLGRAMLALDAALRRQRPAMQFEIDLARPDREFARPRRLARALEEVAHSPPTRLRQRGEVAQLSLALDHFGRDAAAAVAEADCEQGLVVLNLAAEVAPRRQVRLRRDPAIVTPERIVEGVREHPAPIEPFPPEEIVRKLVGFRPVHLDREETVDPGLLQQLRHRGREAEAVGQPANSRARAESSFEIKLAVKQLAHQALAGRHISVGLDPHAADDLPLAYRDPVSNASEEIRIVLFDLGVVVSGRLIETEIGRAFHQRQRGMEGTPQFPPGLAIGPEPSQIDMGMARQGDLAARREAPLEFLQFVGQAGIGGRDARALGFVERRRLGRDRRQTPDRLLIRRGSDARDIVRRQRWPVEAAQGPLGRREQMRNGFVFVERLGRLGDLRQQDAQPIDLEIDPVERRPVEARLAHGLAERQACDALRRDRESSRTQRKFLVVRVEAKTLRFRLVIAERQQALAADVQAEPRLVDRPFLRDFGPGLEAYDPVASRPGAPRRSARPRRSNRRSGGSRALATGRVRRCAWSGGRGVVRSARAWGGPRDGKGPCRRR